MKDFKEIMEAAVTEIANPKLPMGFEARMMSSLAVSSATLRLMIELPSKSVFASIWEGVRELVSPQKLSPLVLESRSIIVADPLASTRNSRPMVWAVLAHAVVILVIGWVVEARTSIVKTLQPPMDFIALDAPLPKLPPRTTVSGGGGGQEGPAPVTQGHLPKFSDQPILPPKVPPLNDPKIAIEPAVEVQKDLKMADNTLPNVGMPNSPIVGLSMGNGHGNGDGGGNGNGLGPGFDAGVGGGPHRVGGGITRPEVLFQPEAEFSEEARKAKFSGDVLVSLWVDEHGNPTHLRIARGVGLGLDEKALEAVRQYKFKPAMKNGKPVLVEMFVDVDFHIL